MLAEIPREAALRAEWGSRESVGAALLLAAVPPSASVLVAGPAFLGTGPAAAQLGMRVALADDSVDRLRFARARFADLGQTVKTGASFDAASFDLVVLPDAPASLPGGGADRRESLRHWLREAFRVLRPGGELLVLAANRFAYKQFSGLHGKFDRRGPAAWLRECLAPKNGNRSIRGYANESETAGFEVVERYAPYVSHLDYHYLANLDGTAGPRIEVGLRERRNLMKWAGYAAGLFPWLVPSLALVARKPGGPPRAESLLYQIIGGFLREIGAPQGPVRVDHLLATRGNAAIALVRAGDRGLVFRIPLCRKEMRLGERHDRTLGEFRSRSARMHLPEPLGRHSAAGISYFVESRCEGIHASQHTGLSTRAATLAGLAEDLAELFTERRAATPELLETLVRSRARLVASRMRDPAVAACIGAIAERACALLDGAPIPCVVAHGDLRAKHVMIHADGSLAGLLDWGTARAPNLPLFDLMHFIIHDRKQQFDEVLDRATISVLHPRHFAPREEAALSDYCARLGIDERVRRACELLYPLEVAATAFFNWDYDRPRWVEDNFAKTVELAARG
jgi:aminoglycoside phosphotransferase (APT) family kinase protein/SAM-dependent methyltransferase